MISALLVLGLSGGLYADLAMKQTQDFLRDPKTMSEAAQSDPKAKKAIQNVQSLSGGNPEVEKTIYDLSAQIFGNFEGKSSDEILKILSEAQKDPKSFYNSLSVDQKKMIREISERIPASKVSSP